MKDLPIMKDLRQTLQTSEKRLKLLAEVAADADRPGALARDIDPKALEGKKSAFKQKLQMSRTNPNHIHHVTSTAVEPKIVTDRSRKNMDLQGNNIDVNQTLENFALTEIQFKQASTVFRKMNELLKIPNRK